MSKPVESTTIYIYIYIDTIQNGNKEIGRPNVKYLAWFQDIICNFLKPYPPFLNIFFVNMYFKKLILLSFSNISKTIVNR